MVESAGGRPKIFETAEPTRCTTDACAQVVKTGKRVIEIVAATATAAAISAYAIDFRFVKVVPPDYKTPDQKAHAGFPDAQHPRHK
ncbi:hypothetical protein PMKS-001901 [Pichia membranifaciens]|uniref:Uncharacterized protein n=1 Tax=Pichia membranifaciens TaxID=4926 RepID=A0A1Q2YFT1_9ASCO|nr:hypothetical protein PMKS-001901 [Pichia membranifaciens]